MHTRRRAADHNLHGIFAAALLFGSHACNGADSGSGSRAGSPGGNGGSAGSGGSVGRTGTGAASGAPNLDAGDAGPACELPAGASVGWAEGNQLPEVVLKDCDGNDVALRRFCGADALWVFGAFGWCPLCRSVGQQSEALHDAFAGQNLASVHVIIEDVQGNPPNADFCKTWQSTYGLTDVVTLYDPLGSIRPLWPDTSSLSAFMDRRQVIVSKLAHESSIERISAGIDGALEKR